MAKYKITDPESGRSLVVSGNRPPTQEDAMSLFVQAGIRKAPAPQDKRGILSNLSDIFFGKTKEYVKGKSPQDLFGNLGLNVQGPSPIKAFKKDSLEPDPKGIAAMGELGSYLIPGGQLGTGNRITRILSSTLQGGEMAALRSATDYEGKTPSEYTGDVALDTLVGAGTGTVIQTGIEGLKWGQQLMTNKISGMLDKVKDNNATRYFRRKAAQQLLDFKKGDVRLDEKGNNRIAEEFIDWLNESGTKYRGNKNFQNQIVSSLQDTEKKLQKELGGRTIDLEEVLSWLDDVAAKQKLNSRSQEAIIGLKDSLIKNYPPVLTEQGLLQLKRDVAKQLTDNEFRKIVQSGSDVISSSQSKGWSTININAKKWLAEDNKKVADLLRREEALIVATNKIEDLMLQAGAKPIAGTLGYVLSKFLTLPFTSPYVTSKVASGGVGLPTKFSALGSTQQKIGSLLSPTKAAVPLTTNMFGAYERMLNQ